jgi:hypothetical protein
MEHNKQSSCFNQVQSQWGIKPKNKSKGVIQTRSSDDKYKVKVESLILNRVPINIGYFPFPQKHPNIKKVSICKE